MNKRTNLVWIDLEMTGLIPETDVILELAMIITDADLAILHEGPELVIHQPNEVLERMGPWCQEQHTASGLVDAVRASTTTMEQAQQQVLELIRTYCAPGRGILCGNSVWQDRHFLRYAMPLVVDYLHYRLLDVTSFKIVIDRWYPVSTDRMFLKKESHRALDDIRESIEELRHYRKHFFVQ